MKKFFFDFNWYPGECVCLIEVTLFKKTDISFTFFSIQFFKFVVSFGITDDEI